MKALISGVAGVLGSALAEKLLKKGFAIRGIDICRIDEAWRLTEIRDSLEYSWKSSVDLGIDDVSGIDVIVDAGLGVADRPLGNSSPRFAVESNIQPSLRILEVIRRLPVGRRPTVIYPSSFNALYGYPHDTVYDQSMLPNPSSVYGWTKGAAELLYLTYHRAHGIPCVITRVGSGYGPRMRSDELPARLILGTLRNENLVVRSPGSKRLWTYIEDVTEFYGRLLERLGEYNGQTLHCAGNDGDEIVTNSSLARLIMRIGKKRLRIVERDYEPGELVGGKPISFEVEKKTPLWSPSFSLRKGLMKTYDWFGLNLWRYGGEKQGDEHLGQV